MQACSGSKEARAHGNKMKTKRFALSLKSSSDCLQDKFGTAAANKSTHLHKLPTSSLLEFTS